MITLGEQHKQKFDLTFTALALYFIASLFSMYVTGDFDLTIFGRGIAWILGLGVGANVTAKGAKNININWGKKNEPDA